MYYSVRSMFFDLSGRLESWRGGFHAVKEGRQAILDREERLYQERLRQTEREYVRQAMEAYARRRG